MSDVQLTACPRCGTQVKPAPWGNTSSYVTCPSCGLTGPRKATPDQANRAWNDWLAGNTADQEQPPFDPSLLEPVLEKRAPRDQARHIARLIEQVASARDLETIVEERTTEQERRALIWLLQRLAAPAAGPH